jgi:hypothetical protein
VTDFDDLFNGKIIKQQESKEYRISLYFEETLVSSALFRTTSEMLGIRGETSLLNFRVVWCTTS